MKNNKYKISKLLLPLLIGTSLSMPAYAVSHSTQVQTTKPMSKPINKPNQQQQQVVEVVFVLDTTGSMGGLIEGAKNKIWSIATNIQNAKTDVEVRMGLIAYRDRGDTYVTQQYPISSDINSIYASLIEFDAYGGGDHPESVNQALYEAVNNQNWSNANNALRIIFLVGDAPPKMNYQDDVKYMQTVKLAKDKDIIINTILAGSDSQTKRVWQDIAQSANGAFSQIAQDGNVTVIKTPYDEKIHQLNIQLNGTIILYGTNKVREQASKVMDSIVSAAPEASSDMAEFNIKRKVSNRVISGEGDLLQELELKNTSVGGLITNQLPKVMQGMNTKERQQYIENMQMKRSNIQKKIDELAKKRAIYKASEVKKLSKGERNSFDENMIKIIRKQAGDKNIEY